MLAQPWRVPLLLARLARCWLRLATRARRQPRPDVVVVGYLGHFDVLLARVLFRRTPIVLDHLISASTTAADRRIEGGGLKQRLLRAIDAGALRSADVIVVDTDEHLAALPERHRERAVVVLVGAPEPWFAAAPADEGDGDESDGTDETTPLRVIFFGLYTPLQGTPVIGAALGKLAGAPVAVTMVGRGQDEAETRAAAADHAETTALRWVDWVPAAELPALVAEHDVCLGIFGTGEKALRVVPNKVYQGAAAGCAVVTSDTAPQRRVLGEAAVLVPPGDGGALADALVQLATDRAELARLRAAARALARERFTAERIVEPLLARLPRQR
jgi:glycosyltransferase involved in cell wall biosynthesis